MEIKLYNTNNITQSQILQVWAHPYSHWKRGLLTKFVMLILLGSNKSTALQKLASSPRKFCWQWKNWSSLELWSSKSYSSCRQDLIVTDELLPLPDQQIHHRLALPIGSPVLFFKTDTSEVTSQLKSQPWLTSADTTHLLTPFCLPDI